MEILIGKGSTFCGHISMGRREDTRSHHKFEAVGGAGKGGFHPVNSRRGEGGLEGKEADQDDDQADFPKGKRGTLHDTLG
jgi:hypothetical protein